MCFCSDPWILRTLQVFWGMNEFQGHKITVYFYSRSGSVTRMIDIHPDLPILAGDLKTVVEEYNINVCLVVGPCADYPLLHSLGVKVIMNYHGMLFPTIKSHAGQLQRVTEAERYDLAYWPKLEYKHLRKTQKPQRTKTRCSPGSTHLDAIKHQDLLQLHQQLAGGKPSILVVQNHRSVHKYSKSRYSIVKIVNHIEALLQTTIEFAEKYDYQVFLKLKIPVKGLERDPARAKRFWKRINSWGDRLILIPRHELLYKYFFANIILVEGGGTTLPEAVYWNPQTVRVQFVNHHNYFRMNHYQTLLQARTSKQLERFLDGFHRMPKKFLTRKYMRERSEWLRMYYADPDRSTRDAILEGMIELLEKPDDTNNEEKQEIKNDN